MGILSAILGDTFMFECYAPLGELMDMMAITNSAINFILYCFMSKQFRKTFLETFHLHGVAQALATCSAAIRSRCRWRRQGGDFPDVQIRVNNNGGKLSDVEDNEGDALLPQKEPEIEVKPNEAGKTNTVSTEEHEVKLRLEVGDTTL